MIKFINSWAQGIILAVVIATLIEIILPEGNNKKYIKTVIGIYILFSIIYPLITKFSSNNINFNSIISNTTKKMEQYDNLNTIETNAYIESTYKNKLEEDIREKINQKGYTISKINIYVETENEEIYGQINSINIQLEKNSIEKEKSNNVSKIEKININTSESNQEVQAETIDEITEEEIKILKEYLNNTYSIEMEKIHINEKGV